MNSVRLLPSHTTMLVLLVAGLMAGLGVIVSLRSASVRQAQQLMILPTVAIVALPNVAGSIIPHDALAAISGFVSGNDIKTTLALITIALLAAVIGIGLAARSQFSRATSNLY